MKRFAGLLLLSLLLSPLTASPPDRLHLAWPPKGKTRLPG